MSESALPAPNAGPPSARASSEPPATRARPPFAPRDRKAARLVPIVVSIVVSFVVEFLQTARDLRSDPGSRRSGAGSVRRGSAAIAAAVSSSASQSTVCPPGDDDDLEEIAERLAVRVQQVVVREVRALAEHEQRRHAHPLERGRRRRHLAVRRDDRGLASSDSGSRRPAPHEMRPRAPPRGARAARAELALVVAAVDALVEGDVRAVLAGVLRRRAARSRAVRRSPDRGARAAGRASARARRSRTRAVRRTSGRSSIAGSVPTVCDDRVDVSVDAPRRLVGRRAVAEQVRREDAVAGERLLGELREVPPVARDAVQADDARGARLAPLLEASVTGPRVGRSGGAKRLERLGDHLGPPLVALLHERPDDRPVLGDQERAAVRRAGLLVEDPVRLRGGAVRPEVGRERVLRLRSAPSTPVARARSRRTRARPRSARCGTTRGSPGGRVPRPRRPA